MGLLDRLRGTKGGSDEPDATTKEIAACVAAAPIVRGAHARGLATIEVEWPSGRSTDLDVTDLREVMATQKGMDRIETLDTFVEELREPPEAPRQDSEQHTGTPAATVAAPPREEHGEQPSHAGDWSSVAARVLPIVMRVDQRRGDEATGEPIGPLLSAVVSVDGVPVTAAELAGFDRTQQDLWAAAFANLARHMPDPEPIGAGLAAWIITTPRGHQTAWLTNPAEVVASLHLHRAIAFAPTPTDLLVVAPDRIDLLTTITSDTIMIFERGEGTLCPVPHEITHTEVRPWEPADDHPCAELVRRTRQL